MNVSDFDWGFIDTLVYGGYPEGPIGKWLPEMEGKEVLSSKDCDKVDELVGKHWLLCKSELKDYDLENGCETYNYYFKDLINGDYYCLEVFSSLYTEGKIRALYKAEPYTHMVADFKKMCNI